MFRLYLDESGHKDDPLIKRGLSIGGWIGPIEAWERFEATWKPVLRHFCVSELHMYPFAHRIEEFTGWSEQKRRDFIEPFLEFFESEKGVLRPIGNFTPLAEYRVSSSSVEEDAVTLKELAQVDVSQDPIEGCLTAVMHSAVGYLDECPPAEHLEVFFDERDDSHTLRDWYNKIRAPHARIGPLIFLPSVQYLPIQAADFVAYELAKQMNDPKRPRKTYQRLEALNPLFSQS